MCFGSKCFHTIKVDLLDTLQKAAHKEIRQKILLIAGKRLPAELTDHIFREALLAEDIPEQPEVKEWKDFPVEQQRRKCVKEIYRCGKMSWYD